MGRRDDGELDLSLFNNVKDLSEKRQSDRRQSDRRQSDRRQSDRRKTNSSRRRDSARYIDDAKSSRKNVRKKKKGKAFKVLLTFLIFILILVGGTVAAIRFVPGAKEYLLSSCAAPLLKCVLSEDAYNNIFDEDFDKDDIIVNEGVNKEKFTGYYTIALFGIDSRDGSMDAGVNSDSIIIASINQDTGHVVLSSVYRDTWLNIPDKDGDFDEDNFRKINSAYCSGGVSSAINTMNTNFDLNISDYVTINFAGLATIIDMLGGIDLNITEAEMDNLNDYLDETKEITGMDADYVTEYGNVHLNGVQATVYCRIRYSAFYDEEGNRYVDDMGRTARQRYVLSLMIEKAKNAGVSKLLDIAETIFSGREDIIRTSIPYDDMMEMIPAFIDFELGETKGFPFTYAYPDKSLTNGESAVAVGGLSYNVGLLHEFLYGDKEYTPSNRVQWIDRKLYELIGVEDMTVKNDN